MHFNRMIALVRLAQKLGAQANRPERGARMAQGQAMGRSGSD